ncbi:polyprotein [Elysia marginata]|uniref:Polyprotein n=1 Tax=Elysia marginata TaxID=1093978 RepID=A0AAV4HMD3_9GAST|nr:polyprotein [Elysia marginata]
MSKPHSGHMTMAKHVFRYLQGTDDFKLIYRKSEEPINVIGFCDADWGNLDDRKSITGYGFKLSKTAPLISWKSRKQPTVALSTCEAEYMALVSATQEGKYLTSLVKEIFKANMTGFVLYCDNQGAIALAKNPVKHQRSKHIDIKYHFIRDEVNHKGLELLYVPSENNVADIITKPLSTMKCNRFIHPLMGK